MEILDSEDKLRKYGDDFIASLKETSFDKDNEEYMTESSLEVYNFDKIKEKYVENNSGMLDYEKPNFRSNDALYLNNGEFVFIEFKNGKIDSNLKIEQLRSKIAESLLILVDILEENLSFTRKNCTYAFVYNKSKNSNLEEKRESSKTMIAGKLAEQANTQHNIIPSFYRYELFFKKVYTINNEELDELLKKLE